MKRIAVLGSTGSIGCQTLDVVRALPGEFEVVGLAGGRNLSLLEKQAAEFRPRFISYSEGPARITGLYQHMDPARMAALPELDIVVIATAGKAGLTPTLAAIDAGKTIALSNKEVLVMAGEIVMGRAENRGARILPVDSEHSAIWQCLEGERNVLKRIILTASGGPFRGYTRDMLEAVTADQALRHPSWMMGKKVTIDSATLMNKGLEIIEAHWLFDVPFDKIEVVLHPRSIVHSMVEFADGSCKAQLSSPDMRFPIQYALTYPERRANSALPRIDWSTLGSLEFGRPDPDSFPCLRLAREAGRRGGTYPAALCGADEVAVELFLSGRIRFTDIPRLVETVLDGHKPGASSDLEAILEADEWARREVLKAAEVASRKF